MPGEVGVPLGRVVPHGHVHSPGLLAVAATVSCGLENRNNVFNIKNSFCLRVGSPIRWRMQLALKAENGQGTSCRIIILGSFELLMETRGSRFKSWY